MSSYHVGLLGHGIGPSLTPPMHRREAGELGLDYRYDVLDLLDRPHADLGVELTRLEEAGYDAVNVTHPFKRDVLEHAGALSDEVQRIGAANLVLLGTGGRTAHNTDYQGFRAGLEGFLGDRPRGVVVQVGAGGAGLATSCVLIDVGFDEVVIHDRSLEAVDSLTSRFATGAAGRMHATGGDLEAWLRRADGIVHVTPTGMREHPGTAVDVELLRSDAWVAEVVYRPLRTELVRRAQRRGLDTLDGGAMAVGQAVDSLRLITGLDPDRDRMEQHFHTLVADAERAAS